MSAKPDEERDVAMRTDRKPKAAGRTAKRSSPRRDVIESQVCDVATNLFAERRYGGTTLQDIAGALGVSRTALYYYVPARKRCSPGLSTT